MLKRWWNNRRNSNGEMIVEKKEEEKEEETIVSYSYIMRCSTFNWTGTIWLCIDLIIYRWSETSSKRGSIQNTASWEHAESSGLRLSHTRLTNSFEGNASAHILHYSSIEFHNLDLRSFASSFRLASNAYRKALKQEFATRQIRQVRNAPLFFFLSSFFFI